MHWLLRKETAAHERLFRALATMLVVMGFVVMASAVQRMRLYQDAYGMTELRFYTTSFIGGLAPLLLRLIATVLRGHRHRFALAALAAAFLAIGLLDQLKPHALIARA